MFKDLDNLGKWELGGDISLENWKLKVNGVSGRCFFRSLDITTPPVCRPGIQIGDMVRKGVCLLITLLLFLAGAPAMRLRRRDEVTEDHYKAFKL